MLSTTRIKWKICQTLGLEGPQMKSVKLSWILLETTMQGFTAALSIFSQMMSTVQKQPSIKSAPSCQKVCVCDGWYSLLLRKMRLLPPQTYGDICLEDLLPLYSRSWQRFPCIISAGVSSESLAPQCKIPAPLGVYNLVIYRFRLSQRTLCLLSCLGI